jgi:hypothetical protein
MTHDVPATNHDATVTLPAHLLYKLICVTQGYTRIDGEWVFQEGVIREVQQILNDTDYKTYYPSFLTGKWEGNKHSIVPVPEFIN